MRRRNPRGKKTGRAGRPLLVLASLVALLSLLPFVLPLQLYIPRLERAISLGLQEPVSISQLKLSLYPAPHLRLEGVAVGPLREISIQSVTVYPDLFSIMKPVKILNSVELDGIEANDEVIEKVDRWIKSSKGPSAFQSRDIKLRHVDLKPGKADFGLLDADIRLNPGASLAHAAIYTSDGRLNIEIRPDKGNYTAALSARHWRIPVEPYLLFDTLSTNVLFKRNEISLSEVNGFLYGGTLEGSAILNWQEGWKVNGELKAADIQLDKLMPLFTTSASVSGRLNLAGDFHMSDMEFGKLMDRQEGSYRFNVNNGVIYNTDLARAVRAATREVRGGQTSFEQLSGTLQIKGKAFYFQDLHIASGLLKAQGNLKVAPSSRISGHARVDIKGTASMLSMPMEISGNLSDPVLRPEKSAVAGAIAGTAILGPGVGTGIGAKAGEFVNKLVK